MTFSIIARCPRTGQFGVAAATAMPAVGKLLSHAAARVGAVATQAQINPYLGIDGLRLLREGCTASEVIDRHGEVACWTGAKCPPWAGAIAAEQFCVQGNRLAGRAVLKAAAEAYRRASARPLVERLMEALAAGDAGGGDRCGDRLCGGSGRISAVGYPR